MEFTTTNTSISPINTTKSSSSDTTYIVISGILNSSGFIVNCMAMIHSIKNHRAQNNTNYLIRNLLLANVLSSLAWAILTINLIVAKQICWPFTLMHYTCKFGVLFWLISYTASVGILTLLSIERYNAIIRPTRPRLQGFKLNIVLIVLWIISIIVSIPIGFIASVDKVVKFDCVVPIERSQTFYVFHIIFLDVIDYLLPTCIMIYCYTRVVIKLRQTSINAARSKKNLSIGERRKKQVTKKLICLTICFTITAVPWLFSFNLPFILNKRLLSPQHRNPHLENFIIFIPLLFSISLFYDPIFYILNIRNGGNVVENNGTVATLKSKS